MSEGDINVDGATDAAEECATAVKCEIEGGCACAWLHAIEILAE